MHICFDLVKTDYLAFEQPVVTLGTFDGVHLGHQKIIQRVIEKAGQLHKKSVVVTYEPHPQTVVARESAPLLLTTLEEKLRLLESLKIEESVIINFNAEFSNYSAQEFIDKILVKKLNPGYVIIGYDHAFGKNRTGRSDLLKEVGKIYGFGVEVVGPVEYKEKPVNSTRIRKTLQEGDFQTAVKLLGHSYEISGTVCVGEGTGKELGYPTANISYPANKLLPPPGIYSARVLLENSEYLGMAYLGKKPTFNKNRTYVEVHIFDFEKKIYDRKISLFLEKWVREDRKFDTTEQLIFQLREDELKIKQLFGIKKI